MKLALMVGIRVWTCRGDFLSHATGAIKDGVEVFGAVSVLAQRGFPAVEVKERCVRLELVDTEDTVVFPNIRLRLGLR